MNISIYENKIYYYDEKNKKDVYLCKEIGFERVIQNVESNKLKYAFYYYLKGIKNTFDFEDTLNRNNILAIFPKYGIDVNEGNVNIVLRYLQNKLEYETKIIFEHSNLGWNKKDELIFNHHKSINSKINSTYNGAFNVEPKGEYSKELDLIKNEVVGNPNLELALILGLSAPVVALLKEYTGVNVLFFHIFGDSSSGKTTAAELAVSTFGKPSMRDGGLIKSWNATKNAIIGYQAGANGIPLVLDEASVNTIKNSDYANVVYEIAEGVGKARMSKDGLNRRPSESTGTIISTAEESILRKCSNNNGLRVRLIELDNIQWTISAENANKIKEGVRKNYGHVGQAFVNHIIDKGEDEVCRIFDICKAKISKVLVNDAFTDRISTRLALIYCTALIAEKALGIKFNKKIIKILIGVINNSVGEREIEKQAYYHLLEHVNLNRNSFIKDAKENSFESFPSGKIVGKLTNIGNSFIYNELWIPRKALEGILKSYGYVEPIIILKKWRELGIISADDGKFTKKRKFASPYPSIRVVVIDLNYTFKKDKDKKEKVNNEKFEL